MMAVEGCSQAGRPAGTEAEQAGQGKAGGQGQMAQAGALVSTRAIQAGTTVLWQAKLEYRNRPVYMQQARTGWD